MLQMYYQQLVYLVVSDNAHFDSTISTNTMVHGDRSGSATEEDVASVSEKDGEDEDLSGTSGEEDTLDAGATLLADAAAMVSDGSDGENENPPGDSIPESITPSKQSKKWYSIHMA
jgi:hypothetical protein